MRIILPFIFTMIIYSSGHAQKVQPRVVAMLPPAVGEASGIESIDSTTFWIHNDSGDDAILYQVSKNGKLEREIVLENVNAIDFEDVTRDDSGNMYIGDFGNNKNQRDPLYIYKIPSPASLQSDTVTPEIISFGFEDQKQFPPPQQQQVFDCESVFHHAGKLYLFSKNYGVSNFTKIYSLPDQPGSYEAKLLDSFNTGGLITAADISPSGDVVALLTINALWLFYDFDGTDFFGGKHRKVEIPLSQKEGIVFADDENVFIVDERNMVFGMIYSLNISAYLTSTNSNNRKKGGSGRLYLYPNPATDQFNLDFFLKREEKISIHLHDESGRSWLLQEEVLIKPGINQFTLSLPQNSEGTYWCTFRTTDGMQTLPLVVVK